MEECEARAGREEVADRGGRCGVSFLFYELRMRWVLSWVEACMCMCAIAN
jgi:hypothetical protein